MQVTVVVPIGNIEPEAGDAYDVGIGSDVVGRRDREVTTRPDGIFAFSTIGPGTVRTGAVVSAIVRSAFEMSKYTLPTASTLIRASSVADAAGS